MHPRGRGYTEGEGETNVTPNKAMKRTSLPVTFSAYAEKPPGGVGR
jgi:hypothetical protein